MGKGQCRICHSMQELNRMNQVRSHKSKYTHSQCKGAFKPPVERVEQPLDYQEGEQMVAEYGVNIFIAVYLVGVLTGIIASYWIF